MTAQRVLDSAVAEAENDERQDEEDEDRGAGEKDDRQETRLVGWLLFELQLHTQLDAEKKQRWKKRAGFAPR